MFQGRGHQPSDALEERVMLGIALVPEKRELFGTMPVEDNLVLGGFRQVRQRNRQLARPDGGRCTSVFRA
jgi:ABC-type branched-subunit amino acid transport system ATPase component